MVRKRGGASGQGGGKRAATSPPIGATYKDSRRNIQGDEDFDDEDVVIHNKQKKPEKLKYFIVTPRKLTDQTFSILNMLLCMQCRTEVQKSQDLELNKKQLPPTAKSRATHSIK